MKYPGSKWNIASRLVELIPEHRSYVEPFFGSGAVLFNKPVSDIETINDLDHDVVNLFRCIQEDAERLRMVQIENRPALEVIERFNYSNVFMYIDPPYVLGTRAQKQYRHEMLDQDHEELLKVLLKSRAKIMISGYESEMYNDYLVGWEKKHFSSCAETGKPRTETVWMNYKADPQMSLEDFLK